MVTNTSDQSCNHTAFSADALVASHLNRGPCAKQPLMRDTVWAGRVQQVNENGIPKGAARILQERGINTAHLGLDEMKTILANHLTLCKFYIIVY